MASRIDLPPAVAALVELGAALARQAPSARIAVARAGGILPDGALPPEVEEWAQREVERARAATLVALDAKDVEKVLRDAWRKPASKVLDELDPEPLAVRPAAQVHRGVLDDEPVAVKVRRPGVERGVRNDLALLEALAAPLRAAFPRLDAGAVLRDAREQALDELDLEHEASQQRRVGRALRGVEGITVPRPHLDLCTSEVLVADLVEGTTLADGGRAADPAAAARALVAAYRAAALDAGLAPVDPRASHVVVGSDGTLGLLGLGVARPVDRDRARRGLDGLAALAADDAGRFGEVAEASGILGADEAAHALPVLRTVLGSLIDGEATLDASALRELTERALRAVPDLTTIAMAASPDPQDLALARMLGQLVALLAHLGATDNWTTVAIP